MSRTVAAVILAAAWLVGCGMVSGSLDRLAGAIESAVVLGREVLGR